MNGLQWDGLSAEERLLAEHAVMQFRVLRKACSEAPDGKVLSIAEQLAISQGREATRRTLETALQLEAAEAEKKGGQAEPAKPVEQPGRTVDSSRDASLRRRGN
jgi:hypothetical protein